MTQPAIILRKRINYIQYCSTSASLNPFMFKTKCIQTDYGSCTMHENKQITQFMSTFTLQLMMFMPSLSSVFANIYVGNHKA